MGSTLQHGENGETRIFLVRHGERLDHALPHWAAHAARPHDSPLTPQGLEQARLAGEYIRQRLGEIARDSGVDDVIVRTSPLVRCVQTASRLVAGLGNEQHPVQVDHVLCEEEDFLRPRMLGTHALSVEPFGQHMSVPRSNRTPRGVCNPVLLSAGDLVSVYPHVDLGYQTAHPVAYDSTTGAELNALTGQPQSAHDRAQTLVTNLPGQIAPPRSTTVFVTHGRFARRIGEIMLAGKGGTNFGNFAYCEVAEMVLGADENAGWSCVSRYCPAGDSGRSKML